MANAVEAGLAARVKIFYLLLLFSTWCWFALFVYQNHHSNHTVVLACFLLVWRFLRPSSKCSISHPFQNLLSFFLPQTQTFLRCTGTDTFVLLLYCCLWLLCSPILIGCGSFHHSIIPSPQHDTPSLLCFLTHLTPFLHPTWTPGFCWNDSCFECNRFEMFLSCLFVAHPPLLVVWVTRLPQQCSSITPGAVIYNMRSIFGLLNIADSLTWHVMWCPTAKNGTVTSSERGSAVSVFEAVPW